MGNDVWFTFLAPCTGTAVASFCGAGSATYDTVLAAWSGSCASLSQLACNDDTCGLRSQVSFGVTAGTLYYISVGGFFGATGSFNLDLSCLAPTGNDSCGTAIVVTESIPVSATNIGSSTGPEPVGSCGGMQNDVWFVITPACSGPYTATTCDLSTSYDTVVAIWDGSNGCGGLVELACNDDNCGLGGLNVLNSTVSWNAVAGSTYYISVGGFFGSTGAFMLTVNNGGGLSLGFIDAGPGTIGYQVLGGPPAGSQFTAVSLVAGAFPNGWFNGLDIPFVDLVGQINVGFPFSAPLGPCGDVTVGPFAGVPSGLALYAVTLAFPQGSLYWSSVSPPATGVVP